MTCYWVLRAPIDRSSGFVIQLATLQIALDPVFETNSDCSDNLEAFEGSPGNLGDSLARWCDGQKVIKTNNMYMTIRFASNEQYTGQGFVLEFALVKYATAECQPGNVIPIYAGKAPLYEEFTVKNSERRCIWRIEAIDNTGAIDLNSALVIEAFTVPSLWCDQGRFVIFDGSTKDSPKILEWCNELGSFSQIYLSSSYATLTFVFEPGQEVEEEKNNLQLKIYSRNIKYSCSSTKTFPNINVGQNPVYFSLPTSIHERDAACGVLVSQQGKDFVRLDVLRVKGQSVTCDTDAVVVERASILTHVNKQCNLHKQPMYLTQHSDVIVTSKFSDQRVYLKATSVGRFCGGAKQIVLATSDMIKKEKVPVLMDGKSEVPLNCVANLVISTKMADESVVAKINVPPSVFQAEDPMARDPCMGDIINVFDGNSSTDRLLFSSCNQTHKSRIYSEIKVYGTKPWMLIQFNTNDYHLSSQINVEFYAVPVKTECLNKVLTVNSSGTVLKSPNYPNYYPLDYNCSYQVVAESVNDVVVIDVMDANFSRGCRDILSFYNGMDNHMTSEPFGRVCGYDRETTFVSKLSSATIQFLTDEMSSEGGWMLQVYTRKGGNSSTISCLNLTLLFIALILVYL
ncbi:uncharacterized protein LOC131927645 [Physella acuta]|uniref:uncharacterized protein LOC131927645 n=1 Tax=Physella acuta TaxID=109671 RepID=UPI0027DBD47C|nr:uncharacterized protein LOC131927645 [Physella acuta]